MAQRVNPTEVKEILETSLSDAVVQTSIDIASRYLDDVLVGQGLAADRLADVELYLSAHFVAMTDQSKGSMVEEETGEARAKYSGFFSKGLEMTRYGQMAIFLDTSGILASTAQAVTQKKALFTVVAPVETQV